MTEVTATPVLPGIDPAEFPGLTVEFWRRWAGRLHLGASGTSYPVDVERCAAGRLRDVYPVAARDVEVRPGPECRGEDLTSVLEAATAAVRRADPRCRRLVLVADADDVEGLRAAEEAGFRYVVDVDVAGRESSLLTAEPAWVTTTDGDLDHVPGA